MVIDYKTIECKAQSAKELMLRIDPEASISYTYNEYGHKLCNGLNIDDCQNRCHNIMDELISAGHEDEAMIATSHVPLFVFAALDHDRLLEFIRVMKQQGQDGASKRNPAQE